MMKKIILLCTIFSMVFLTFMSCEKEETQNQGPDYGPGY